ncbi:hypothetical protein [Lachnoclostridium sp. Marseille-P6806]|uniref:hypothetical protein n=1 Tax=Lachnoclostridium sp. Marseille-P6806 TaxID=2364793 RepID=UPI00103078D7|nr:hypothetical protein [Lachnoclostridium sp. Marseille-P6806]
MKRYIEVVDVDDNGKKTVVKSEEKRSLKEKVKDFGTKHPKAAKAAKIIGIGSLAVGCVAFGLSRSKRSETSSFDELPEDDLQLDSELESIETAAEDATNVAEI